MQRAGAAGFECVLEGGVAGDDSVRVIAAILIPAPKQRALEGTVPRQAVLQRVIDGLVGGILALPFAKLHHSQTLCFNLQACALPKMHPLCQSVPQPCTAL